MRSRLDEQLSMLDAELLEMGALIEHAITNACGSLEGADVGAANKAIDIDMKVDQKEREVESLCLKMLLRQQPVAKT